MIRRVGGGVVLLVLTFLLSGCYYVQLVQGQLRVFASQVPIAQALEDAPLSERERQLLSQVPGITRFARLAMGLNVGRGYSTFVDTGTKPISTNVSACAKTAFKPVLWEFPFVGKAPYKGFFQREDAEREAAKLRKAGYDVRVSNVLAYSTLGWFADPVFRPMLWGGEYGLVSTTIHELTHATVFRPGAAVFNESLATVVGQEGALDFLAQRYGAGSAQVARARQYLADAEVVRAALHAVYNHLDALYRSTRSEAEKLALREKLFAGAQDQLGALSRRLPSGAFAYLGTLKLDNCFLLAYRTYNSRVALFAQVHKACDGRWEESLRVYRQAADVPGDPFVFLKGWLAARCSGPQSALN